ncbi:flagellar hook-associated family protein [Jiella sp. M17.18]|uniref:flagellar hook-associated family protein n=1 Tax=Jiella sp. M17.18 TaxID=3234247 RepID=UPI0034DEAF53
MSNFLVSNYSLLSAPRTAVFKIQDELTSLQKEVTTGRLDDVGLSLGGRTSQTVSLRSQQTIVDKQRDANSVLTQRFDIMQTSLQSIADTGNTLLSSLIANGTSDTGTAATEQQAMSSLQQMVGALNTSSGTRFLFSGAASDQQTLKFSDFVGSGAQSSVASALSNFMTTNGISDMSQMTDSQLDSFLNGDFANLFSGSNWTANWSNADDTPVYNKISDSETINTSYSANDEAFRNIAKAYVMMSSLNSSGMSDSARQLLSNRATQSLSQGLSQMTTLQAQIGGSQQRLDATDAQLKSRSNVLTLSISSMEEVDPYEASTRVTNLTNLLEASYSLTARISKLSILNYIS